MQALMQNSLEKGQRQKQEVAEKREKRPGLRGSSKDKKNRLVDK